MRTDLVEILVVDDEPVVRNVLHLALQGHGFTVHLAGNGKQALDVYQREQQTIAIVLLDVQMPEMDGPRTLAELQTINPTVICCFMSGGLGRYSQKELLQRGAVTVLSKPFNDLGKTAELLHQFARSGKASN